MSSRDAIPPWKACAWKVVNNCSQFSTELGASYVTCKGWLHWERAERSGGCLLHLSWEARGQAVNKSAHNTLILGRGTLQVPEHCAEPHCIWRDWGTMRLVLLSWGSPFRSHTSQHCTQAHVTNDQVRAGGANSGAMGSSGIGTRGGWGGLSSPELPAGEAQSGLQPVLANKPAASHMHIKGRQCWWHLLIHSWGSLIKRQEEMLFSFAFYSLQSHSAYFKNRCYSKDLYLMFCLLQREEEMRCCEVKNSRSGERVLSGDEDFGE